MDSQLLINEAVREVLSALHDKFGKLDSDDKIPAHKIGLYIQHTRDVLFSNKALIASTVDYLIKSVQILKSTKLDTPGKEVKNSHRRSHSHRRSRSRSHNHSKNHDKQAGTMSIQLIKLINEAFSQANHDILVNILRQNRFVLYLAQYSLITNKPGYYDDLPTQEYFGIPVVYYIAYLAVSYAIHTNQASNVKFNENLNNNLLDYMTMECIISTNTIDNIIQTKNTYNTIQPNKIKRTLLDYHGITSYNSAILPTNKILVIITPINRYGVGTTTEILKAMLEIIFSNTHILNFISQYMCYVNSIKTESATKSANDNNVSEPLSLFNGMQIYYGGNTYFDIGLSSSIDEGLGEYIFDPETNKLKLVNDKPTEMSIMSYIKDDNKPEIIVVNSCRMLDYNLYNNNAELQNQDKYEINMFTELQYRYTKIHDIITDTLAKCLHNSINTGVIKLQLDIDVRGDDYTKFFIQLPRTKKLNRNEYKHALFNSWLSPIRDKKKLSYGQIADYIIKKPFDEKTIEYIQILGSKYKKELYTLLRAIQVDFVPKFNSIFTEICKYEEINDDNTNFVILYRLFNALVQFGNYSAIKNILSLINTEPSTVVSDLIGDKLNNTYLNSINNELINKQIIMFCKNILSKDYVNINTNLPSLENLLEIHLPFVKSLGKLSDNAIDFIIKMSINGKVSNDIVFDLLFILKKHIITIYNSYNKLIQIPHTPHNNEQNKYAIDMLLRMYDMLNVINKNINSKKLHALNTIIIYTSSFRTPEIYCIAKLYYLFIDKLIELYNILNNKNDIGKITKFDNYKDLPFLKCVIFVLQSIHSLYMYDNNYIYHMSQKTIILNIYIALKYMKLIDDKMHEFILLKNIDDKIHRNNIGTVEKQHIKTVYVSMKNIIIQFVNNHTIFAILALYQYYLHDSNDYYKVPNFNPPITKKYKALLSKYGNKELFSNFIKEVFINWEHAQREISRLKHVLKRE